MAALSLRQEIDMMRIRVSGVLLLCLLASTLAWAQRPAPANPLWHEDKVKNYLPHMTSPEVADLLTRTDMVILPIGSLEQHGLQGPIGTDTLDRKSTRLNSSH